MSVSPNICEGAWLLHLTQLNSYPLQKRWAAGDDMLKVW
jgi:hypothetical protein